MGTRSLVGMMIGDQIRAVYVHFDGYLDGVGADLQGYTTQEDVEILISHGDRSELTDGFYKDRGETGVEPVVYDNFNEFYDEAKNSWCEYYYVFIDGVWHCGDTYEETSISGGLVPFSEAINNTV